VGVLITVITGNYGNKVIEKNAKKETKAQINKAVKSFKDSAENETPEEVVHYLKQYINTVINDQVVGIDLARGDSIPKKEDASFLFTFYENGKSIDIYIKKSYLEKEMFELDTPLLIEGSMATLIVFSLMVILLEQKRKVQLKHQSETAALNRALEEQHALVLLGRMTATLAHELKTPIATISNLVYALPAHISNPDFASRFIVLAKEELGRTQRLIDNLLSYGRDIVLSTEEWIELRGFTSALAQKAGLGLECRPIEIRGDKFYLGLLFENLFNNSVQAQAKKIEIKSQSRKEVAEIIYEDDGVGFPADAELDELIKPFVTFHPRGAGLGLNLVQRILIAHGGGLSLQRAARGARIKIRLPLTRVRNHDDKP
ncbi:MAG TPA: ATP-binding protein, partial [Spirochaetota bacterium]